MRNSQEFIELTPAVHFETGEFTSRREIVSPMHRVIAKGWAGFPNSRE